MWFQLALNASAPPVQVLIGVDGLLYFRVWDLGQLLKIRHIHSKFTSFVFPCKNVLPSHRLYPKTIHNTRLVNIQGLFSILHSENVTMRDLFLKALTMGYAHPSGMRKITDKFKKGPTLTLVDLPDAKSVFIPEWIHRFKLDVYRVRREEVKSQKWIPVKAPISTDYPNPKEELFFDSILSDPHNVSQPVIETTCLTTGETACLTSGETAFLVTHETAALTVESSEMADLTMESDERIEINFSDHDYSVEATSLNSSLPIESDERTSLNSSIPVESDERTSLNSSILMESDERTSLNSSIPVESDERTSLNSSIPVESDERTSLNSSIPVESDERTLLNSSIPMESDETTNSSIPMESEETTCSSIPMKLDETIEKPDSRVETTIQSLVKMEPKVFVCSQMMARKIIILFCCAKLLSENKLQTIH
ncbi:hypothetical protein TNCT_430211 [Trichonephila clavata]|uniref:Uncharacterized protein n=1 Tax=Trichonephila clavata TaxID=2740835 RepID=A0A8X6INP7_TRICU|nr:hypothetical protein TNCT_430211 [Trichonephila clavata]